MRNNILPALKKNSQIVPNLIDLQMADFRWMVCKFEGYKKLA